MSEFASLERFSIKLNRTHPLTLHPRPNPPPSRGRAFVSGEALCQQPRGRACVSGEALCQHPHLYSHPLDGGGSGGGDGR